MWCFDNSVLCFKNIVFCAKNCLLCLQIWATVNIRSFEYLKDTGLDSNFLTWSALRLSVPKDKLSSFPQFDPMTFQYENAEFNTYSVKTKQFYSLLIVIKAKYPNSF